MFAAGREVKHLVAGARKIICEFIANNTDPKQVNIDLMGYSRGGYTAIEIAWELKKNKCPHNDEYVNVRFMGLYDPVSSVMQGSWFSDPAMPSNVDNIVISYGNPELGLYVNGNRFTFMTIMFI